MHKAQEGENAEEEKKVYRAKVFDVLSEDQLEIMMPLELISTITLCFNGRPGTRYI